MMVLGAEHDKEVVLGGGSGINIGCDGDVRQGGVCVDRLQHWGGF